MNSDASDAKVNMLVLQILAITQIVVKRVVRIRYLALLHVTRAVTDVTTFRIRCNTSPATVHMLGNSD
jgi:hypothetical protein